jgi:hypothetical protein
MEKLPQSVLEFVLCRFLYPWEVHVLHQVSQNFCRQTEHVLFGLKEWKWTDNMFFKRVRQGFIRRFRIDHNFNPEHFSIPTSVTHLTFGRGFNQPLVEDSIPESVTHLTFGHRFDQPFVKGSIPESVTHLTFGYCFDQPLVKGSIPESVTQLTFRGDFNQTLVKGSIPESVTHLTFRGCFNQPLVKGFIPESVTHLTFGEFWFDQNVGQMFDSGIRPKLEAFGYYFKKKLVNGSIPNSVARLTFGEENWTLKDRQLLKTTKKN